MQNITNIKSMLIGMTLGALIVLSIAAATQNAPTGRFQLATSMDHYIFKIDTITGQVWKTGSENTGYDFLSANVSANVSK
jgi:hypothetical protein